MRMVSRVSDCNMHSSSGSRYITSLFWAKRPDDHGMCRNWDRHDVTDAAFCTAGRQLIVVYPGDGALCARPGEHARCAVWVMLP